MAEIQMPLVGGGEVVRGHVIPPPVDHHHPRKSQHRQMLEACPGFCPMILAISLTMRGSPSLDAPRMAWNSRSDVARFRKKPLAPARMTVTAGFSVPKMSGQNSIDKAVRCGTVPP